MVHHITPGIEYFTDVQEFWLSCPVSFLKGNLLMNCSRVTWWQPFHVRHLLRWHSRLTCTDLSKNLKRIASCQSRRKKYDKRICVYLVATYTHIHIGVFRWTYMKLDHHRHVSTHCNWCIQCTCRSERSRVKQITEKSTYHWQMDWSLQGKKINNHLPIDPAISGILSQICFKPMPGMVHFESIEIATATSCGIEGIHILTNHWPTTFSWSCFLERSKNRVPPHHWFPPTSQHWFVTLHPTFEYCQKTALRNGVGPTQTLVSSSVYVSS